MSAAETGRLGERLAAEFLEARGYRVLDANYRFQREEVDLVCFQPTPADDGGEIVFVEVKARRGTGADRRSAFGPPEAAVTPAKQAAIKRVAEAWLLERRMMPSPVRFDVVAVTLDARDRATIEHFENAFGYFV